jgi:hypothetical protein
MNTPDTTALPPEALHFQHLLDNPVALHDDLVPYLEDDREGGLDAILRHPLVYAVPYLSVFNANYNGQLTMKRQQLIVARRERNWDQFIWLHERPYRLTAFAEVVDEMTDHEYWSTLANVWIDSDNIRQNQATWERLWRSDRGNDHLLMDLDERETLAAMPDVIRVWQGHTTARDDGWSWTTERETAVWFARRFALLEGGVAAVSEATVPKETVLAYFARRGEHEVIVNARNYGVVNTIELEDES